VLGHAGDLQTTGTRPRASRLARARYRQRQRRVLLSADGSLIEPTFHYRDRRTERGIALAHAKIGWPEIFAETGIQFMPLNTLYQLAAEEPRRLDEAASLLLIGDGCNHYLCGKITAEVTLASTTMLMNPTLRGWSGALLDRLGIPARLFPPIVSSGTRLGTLRPEIARPRRLKEIEVLATCSHDTGAAVAATPAQGKGWAYLSSGTWSLMGVERAEPVISDRARELNFTNEIGFGGTIRLLKNISGLWLLQECRRSWAELGTDIDYRTLVKMAAAARPFVSLINPADPRFLAPDQMPQRIAAYCSEKGQPVPEDPGAMTRCILESLALLYRQTRNQLELVTGERIDKLHIIGGGSQNDLLNQFAADALQCPVFAGPTEATAVGNLLVQAHAMGQLSGLDEIRAVARNSFEIRKFNPGPAGPWDDAFERFRALIADL
jgi:rhamnulokinase